MAIYLRQFSELFALGAEQQPMVDFPQQPSVKSCQGRWLIKHGDETAYGVE
ncbi:hypothetical protein GCM10007421_28280 [Halopseudomonas oceani]|nr:hypothetical protein GCM10007421_28280 [Halopseudomonas oceani]